MSGFDLFGIGEFGPQQPLRDPPAVSVPPARLLGETVVDRDRQTVGGVPFGGLLAEALERTAGLQQEVRSRTESLLTGEPVALHDIMLSMGKSEVAFNLMLEVRNKLVEAWEKLSRSVV